MLESLKPKHRLKLSLKDLDSKAEFHIFVDSFGENLDSDLRTAAVELLETFKGGKVEQQKQQQDETEFAKAAEQKQDLTHHKTEETDVLVKAEAPADDFMQKNDLDKKTHGKISE